MKMYEICGIFQCHFMSVFGWCTVPFFCLGGGGWQMIKFSIIPEPEFLGDFEGIPNY